MGTISRWRGTILTAVIVCLICTMFMINPPANAASGFVQRSGTQFVLDGKRFYFGGSNTYYLEYKPPAMVDDALQNAADMGLRVMRVWGWVDIGSYPDTSKIPAIAQAPDGVYFQYWDTGSNTLKVNTGANGLQHMDYYVWKAGQLGLKLVIPFTNNWSDFGGMDQYINWFSLTYHDEFYSNKDVKAAYKNYINTLLNHENPLTHLKYKDDPTIMTWELANEPRCGGTPDKKPTSSTCNPALITAWADEMSTYIKSVDSNHLVAVGDEGFFNQPDSSEYEYNGGSGIDYKANLALKNIDYGTYHLYPEAWKKTADWGTQWILDHTNVATALGKPSVLEEFGMTYDGSAKDTQDERNRIYDTWINQVCAGHGNWMYWMLAARQASSVGSFTGMYPDYDKFTVYYKTFSDDITPSGAKMAARAAAFSNGKCDSSGGLTSTEAATQAP